MRQQHSGLPKRPTEAGQLFRSAPATDPNPWPGIRVAVDDQVNGISLLAALRAYTSGGAYASFEEGIKGTLKPGMLADLQVYRGDPLEVLKWKDVYEKLEAAIDRCENVANIIEGVIIKHS